MINITHSVGGLGIVMFWIFLTIFQAASIWILILSVYLGQLMDIDTKDSSISKKIGLRSIGAGIRLLISGHRKETHSFFFAFCVTILLSPLSFYFSLLDRSDFLVNSLLIFTAVSSHALLDLGNRQGVPLFYIPYLNPLSKAKFYSLWNTKIGGIEVGGENEFYRVTLPFVLLCIFLFIIQFDLYYEKILIGSEFILQNIAFSLFLLVYSIWGNYLFTSENGFKDFIYSLYTGFKNNDLSQVYWDSPRKILWESNFTKILTSLLLLFSISFNGPLFFAAVGDFFLEKYYLVVGLFYGDGNFITRIAETIHQILIRFFY